ncbi:MAG TPA: OmpH family outer membrane protein [Desulfomonilaceae bacterium]|nr:OmpH family outer membrane protein [Desulfomonilaceae bacterium]
MSRHVITIIAAVFAVVYFWAGIGHAQDQKFAFVDMQKFLAKSARAQEQQKKLMQLLESKKTSLEHKRKELVDLQEQLQKQRGMLKDEAKNDELLKIGRKKMEYELAEKDAQESLQNEERFWMETLQRDLTKIIGKVRNERKLSLVFNSAALLSADDSLDLTEEIARLYDADTEAGKAPAAPKPKAPAPAPAAPKPKAPAK